MSVSRPRRPDLDQLRRQAKELHNAAGQDGTAQVSLMLDLGFSARARNEEGDEESAESGEPPPGDELRHEIAEHLRVAYETADLELFASLLHPDVHWGGGPEGCTNRAQVLAWYQNQLRRGARGAVTATEVRGDAIVIGLTVARAAVGARPIPPDVVYQLLRVSDGLVVSITGFQDLAAARAAALAPPETT